MTKPVGWQMACSPRGRGVNSVTSTWLALSRARVFYYVWVYKTCEGAQARSPAAEPRLSERATFFYAMSIAKRIWPAILIDSKFSTKLHGTGLSPIFSDWKERFLLKRLEEQATTYPALKLHIRGRECKTPSEDPYVSYRNRSEAAAVA